MSITATDRSPAATSAALAPARGEASPHTSAQNALSATEENAPGAPDQHLVALLGSVKEGLLEEMYRRVAEAGYPGLRPSHGCVFRYLDLDGSRLSDLAEKSGMTKQAFGEHLANVEALGYIKRVPDPDDGRAKLIVPTRRGREVLILGRRAFAEIEHEWGQAIGAARVAGLRETLEQIDRLMRAPRA